MSTILVVEDDEVLCRMYQRLLQNHRHYVLIGVNGEEGLKLALEEHPDLILLDIRMPKMDGISMLKLLRKDAWGAGVPVILLTNLAPNVKNLKEVVGDNPPFYIIKSNIEPEQLLKRIKYILKEYQAKVNL